MSEFLPDGSMVTLNECDKEPIHIPGSIQPYGMMLIARVDDQTVVAGAGDIEAEFGDRWIGSRLADLLHQVVYLIDEPPVRTTLLGTVHGRVNQLNASAFASGDYVVVELEPKLPEDDVDLSFVRQLSIAASAFERSASLVDLSAAAAHRFREMTGYARVMIYKFLDDDSGVVIAESAVRPPRPYDDRVRAAPRFVPTDCR